MTLSVSAAVIQATTSRKFEYSRQMLDRRGYAGEEVLIGHDGLTQEDLADLLQAAEQVDDRKFLRVLQAISAAMKTGGDLMVPSFKAFESILKAYLSKDAIHGWIFLREADGHLYPFLVQDVSFCAARGAYDHDTVKISTVAYTRTESRDGKRVGAAVRAFHFQASEVARKKVSDILLGAGLYKETEALHAEYQASATRFFGEVRGGFAEQFRVTGVVKERESSRHEREGLDRMSGHRVIHDLPAWECGPLELSSESSLLHEEGEAPPMPVHLLVRVFDLGDHQHYWVHSDSITPYQYDQSLRDKLVLPRAHRDLLDILTTDLDAFVEDIVEGKSAGNVILCKGLPGVGKTLTAEVYAELMRRPLYIMRAGRLGTTPSQIAESLQLVFSRALRWNCVLVLNEADVFIARRGTNVAQNAIVAEFLHTLEYFEGLLFMSTNRPDDIDDAVISRCAAIIEYEVPDEAGTRAIWKVMAAQNEMELTEPLLSDLINAFPGIAPRDIKNLLRLVLKVVAARKGPLAIETFRRCAMFRAIKMTAPAEGVEAQ